MLTEYRCRENNCTFICNDIAEIRCHLQYMHGQSHEMHEMNFEDQNAYEWLKTYQEQNFVRYIQNTSRTNKDKSKSTFFNCNRDGKSKSQFKKKIT